MSFNRTLNRFLAAILILIYHVFVGAVLPRDSAGYLISMYIFVLVMIYIVGMPVDEKTGEIQEEEFKPTIDLGRKT